MFGKILVMCLLKVKLLILLMGVEKRVFFGFIVDFMVVFCVSFCGVGLIKGVYFMKNCSVCY